MVPFRSTQRVYFDDLDALNILHNVRFLLFMERARGELFNQLGFRWQDSLATNPDKHHVVAAHDIRYLAPVYGEGEILVELFVRKLGHSSCVIEGLVQSLDQRTLYARAVTRIVRLDPETNRPTSWSERFRAAIAPLARPSESQQPQ